MPGLWRLDRARGCNVYVIEAGGTLLLIDSGLLGSTHRLVREIEELLPGRSPAFVLLTHRHADPPGGAAALRTRFAARVVAGAADCEVEGGRTFTRRHALGGPLPRWLLPRALEGARTEVDIALDGEVEVVPGVLAVPVPGHTAGSYCYIDVTRGVAFVGDLVLSYPDGLARSMRAINDDDTRYLTSIEAFAQRAPATGLAGHGVPVLEGFDVALRELATWPRSPAFSLGLLPRRLRRLCWFARYTLLQRR
jgi:glyoxylase-like metal-dependent hydrolase (beta-lactamase superfamily II)